MTVLPGAQDRHLKAEDAKPMESYISGEIPEDKQARQIETLAEYLFVH